MKTLERIHLVQFFLFEKDTFEVRGATGFLGPNGTGKSSLMDAIQLVMLGGNMAMARFNAQADGVSEERNLRNYCLGKYIPQADTAIRTHAHTYISLIFRDTATEESLSIGLHIEASHSQPTATIRGRYIFPAHALTLADHLEAVDGGHLPIDWSVFRHNGIAKSRGGTLHDQPESFTREMLFYLRPKGGYAPDAKAFARGFQRSLKLQSIDNVDHAVRHYIVEDRPTDVNAFRRKVETFRQLRDKVLECQQQLEGAAAIRKQYTRAQQLHCRSVTWIGAAALCAVDAALQIVDEATNRCDSASDALNTCQNAAEEAEMLSARCEEEWRSAWKRLTGHTAHIRQEQLKLKTDHAQTDIAQAWGRIRREFEEIASVLSAASQNPLMQPNHKQSINAVLATIRKEREAEILPEHESLQKLLNQCTQTAVECRSTIESQIEQLTQRISEVQLEASRLRVNAKRASEGKTALSEKPGGVLALLRAQGFSVEPVCDLVSITDGTWQPAIEAYLGLNVEALLVARDDEEAAYDFYKSLAKEYPIYGVKMALTSHALRYERKPERGEVAALIDGTDRAALAFVRMQLGSLRCVGSAREALEHRATLDTKGMLVKSGGFERLRLPAVSQLKLGSKSNGMSRAELEAQATSLDKKAADMQMGLDRHRSVAERLAAVSSGSKQVQARIDADWKALNAARDEVFEAEKEMAAANLGDEYQALKDSEQVAKKAVDSARDKARDATKLAAQAQTELKNCQEQLDRARRQHDTARHEYDGATQQEGFDHDLAAQYRERLLNREPAGRRNHAERMSREAFEEATREANEAVSALGAFKSQFDVGIDSSCFESPKAATAWLDGFIENLQATEIDHYTGLAENAYQQAVRSFQMDVASTLADNFTRMDRHLDGLNRTLGAAPAFSNGERYKFRWKARKELSDLHNFILKVELLGPGESLFGSAGEVPIQFRTVLDDHLSIRRGEPNPIDDYRDFYAFDVEIFRHGKSIGMLSDRLGPGSGGEHRAPLYVIFGTALAAAYGCSGNSEDSAGLMLLDEAFDKMDPTNAKAMGRYLVTLGLQPLMFAQDGALGTLTPTLNRYYDMNRVDSVITYIGNDVHPKTHELLESDLPDANPELVTQEVSRLRALESTEHAAATAGT